ncbi:MocR-like pyridoxine biosynthesis transcription factor PdxR [Bradyrhizobium sp. CCGE-LA001]|uniref:MocR-like pyridoxine biosynthesis transcription factor PdxR n=1 Tax=Bradyrhizobium sp. CCGE-LA001 TaxID=1223566 RepID=UPI000745B823|nr:PLP-dependent aminotransferase family protein [Bradyrhizobium sp. CCGE-LA001]AMA57861.1 GntR family transcriptional regulator [Bradyrhizobium sp. CCGE-LA001]
MQKIPTNSSAAAKAPALSKPELPLNLTGPHITAGASAAHRLYQALCEMIVAGLVRPGEPLPPSRTLAKQTGFRRNAVVAAYERLIADGFAEATVGSGTFVAARIPARAAEAKTPKAVIEAPRQGAFALGCTHIDERAVQRFRAFVGRRMRAFGPEHLHYGDPRGSRELRAAIADHLLSARGLRCDPDQIMLTSGTLHALRIVLSAILKAGDRIWCEDPGYPIVRRTIAQCGYRIVPIPVDADGLQVAKGRAAAPSARAAYVTPSHQFPLGVQMSMPRRLVLLEWAKQAGAFVLEDDYDSEFRYDGAPLMSLAGIDHLQRVIYMGTFAKTLFPGLRIGYCALPERLIADVTAARATLDRFPGTLMEGAVADMLNSGAFAANLKRMRKLYREARDALAATLETRSDGALSVPVPSQGLHLVARFDPAVDPRVAAEAKQAAGAEGWLLADTYSRARPLPGFVLGFSGHAVPQLIASAEQLARESRSALRARSKSLRRA